MRAERSASIMLKSLDNCFYLGFQEIPACDYPESPDDVVFFTQVESDSNSFKKSRETIVQLIKIILTSKNCQISSNQNGKIRIKIHWHNKAMHFRLKTVITLLVPRCTSLLWPVFFKLHQNTK